MRNHLKIIRMLYSPYLITEGLLAVELILVVLVLALSTNEASYLKKQIAVCDSYWGKGNYLYFTSSYSAHEGLDPQAVMNDYEEVLDFYRAMPEDRFLAGEWFRKEDGDKTGIALVSYNAAMIEKAADILSIREDIDPGDSIPVCVPQSITELCPVGSVLTMYEPNDFWTGNRRPISYMVCGTFRENQLPIISGAATLKTVESLTQNVQEMLNLHNKYIIISLENEGFPVTSGMFLLADDADGEKLAEELSNEYINYGTFHTYSSMRATTTDWTLNVNKSMLLQGLLLSLVFVSHFVGYLAVSTRHKERTNALLSMQGLTPARLAVYNALAVLLILIPSVLIGILLIPLGEKMYPILTAYGGHGVLWECLGIFAIFVLLVVYVTVRGRLKKGSTILLYRKGM